jgi:hypothetical protein
VFDKLARVTTPANLVAPVEAAPPLRHPDAPAPGTELNLHYDGCFTCGHPTNGMRPVPVGTEVHISATIDACVGSRYFISGEGRLGSSDGPLALRAHAVFAKVDLDHFGRYGASEKLAQFKPHLRDGA